LTYPFELLSSAPFLDAEEKLALVNSLAKRAGAHGMIGGQMIDLLSEGKQMDWELLQQMHSRKTAGLFIAALEFGGILSRAPGNDLETLRQAASAIGLAFQIIDDLLDDTNGKSSKPTAVSLLGSEKAQAKAALLLQTANEHLLSLSRPAPLLSALFEQMVDRKK
jgi:geranylgeranyl pyrophosphate synthase